MKMRSPQPKISTSMQALVSSSMQPQESFLTGLKSITEPLSAAEKAMPHFQARLLAAERLRAAWCSVPFHAKKAERARLAGDEMAYWLDLQGSEATLRRP